MNDELIGAYLDGELDAEKRALVEHWLASDQGAAARLERIRGADALIRDAIPRVAARDDDPIVALIRGQEKSAPAPSLSRVWAMRAAALAAACVLGVFAGRASGPDLISIERGADAQMRVGTEVARVLDAVPSGEATPILGGEVEVALSFQTEAGQVCRQYRTISGRHAADAVACREDGGWRMVVQAAATDIESGDYVPAGSNSPIDVAISALGPAIALEAREERALIDAEWRAGR